MAQTWFSLHVKLKFTKVTMSLYGYWGSTLEVTYPWCDISPLFSGKAEKNKLYKYE